MTGKAMTSYCYFIYLAEPSSFLANQARAERRASGRTRAGSYSLSPFLCQPCRHVTVIIIHNYNGAA